MQYYIISWRGLNTPHPGGSTGTCLRPAVAFRASSALSKTGSLSRQLQNQLISGTAGPKRFVVLLWAPDECFLGPVRHEHGHFFDLVPSLRRLPCNLVREAPSESFGQGLCLNSQESAWGSRLQRMSGNLTEL